MGNLVAGLDTAVAGGPIARSVIDPGNRRRRHRVVDHRRRSGRGISQQTLYQQAEAVPVHECIAGERSERVGPDGAGGMV